MAHFAEIDGSNIVLRVVVIADSDCLDSDGNESESVGATFCSTLFDGGTWKQTSYNGNMRHTFANPGSTYDATKNKFIVVKPFASWVLDSSDDWEAPISKPVVEGKIFVWDESAYQADNATGWVESDMS